MTAYYYVRDDGGLNVGTKSSGSETSLLTGAWSSTPADYYPSLDAVDTAGPAVGDVILVAADHDHETAGGIILSMGGQSIYSVSVTNRDQKEAGAREFLTGTGADMQLFQASNTYTHVEGMIFDAVDYISIGDATGSTNYFKDCIFRLGGLMYLRRDGASVILDNCKIKAKLTGNSIYIGYGAHLKIKGFEHESGSSSLPYLIRPSGNGGATIEIDGADLTGMAATSSLVGSFSGSSDLVKISGGRMLVNSGFSLFNSSQIYPNLEALLFGVDTADASYAIMGQNRVASVTTDIGIYRSATYNGTDKYSVAIESTTYCSEHEPYKLKLTPPRQAAGTATYTVHFARDDAATAWNDREIWLEIVYPDGTNEVLGKLVSTQTTTIEGGSDVTIESGEWTGLTGDNKEMSIAKQVTMGDGEVAIYFCFGVASETVYVCPKVDIT